MCSCHAICVPQQETGSFLSSVMGYAGWVVDAASGDEGFAHGPEVLQL